MDISWEPMVPAGDHTKLHHGRQHGSDAEVAVVIASERAVVIMVEASNGNGAVTDDVSVGATRDGGLLSLMVACGPRDD